ncbi:hypothetical protein [Lysinibacillus piscis]|uniref:Uncharacterized protein n=1 Tax=Lysinibacillus piscis TaxID=2518931 RepID=A0ABQ5NPC6_9BACI|nr:hypothetical protein [Lysinibacillus sp. KH24]GLC90221.1 hypothetical protein LYSBPC_33480 [Lysinibacillus sp. KH24]
MRVMNERAVDNSLKLTRPRLKATDDDKQLKKRQQLEQELKRQEQQAEQLKREMEASKKQMEAEKDAFKIYTTCLEIARRITAGDKVPSKDHHYLLEHDPALYGKSLTLRIEKEDPEEYEQLSEDEESTNRMSEIPSQNSDSSAINIKI